MFQLYMPGYVCAALHSVQHKNLKRGQNSPYPWTLPQYGKNNQILKFKYPVEKLDTSNQKFLQKLSVNSYTMYDQLTQPC